MSPRSTPCTQLQNRLALFHYHQQAYLRWYSSTVCPPQCNIPQLDQRKRQLAVVFQSNKRENFKKNIKAEEASSLDKVGIVLRATSDSTGCSASWQAVFATTNQ